MSTCTRWSRFGALVVRSLEKGVQGCEQMLDMDRCSSPVDNSVVHDPCAAPSRMLSVPSCFAYGIDNCQPHLAHTRLPKDCTLPHSKGTLRLELVRHQLILYGAWGSASGGNPYLANVWCWLPCKGQTFAKARHQCHQVHSKCNGTTVNLSNWFANA